MAENPDGAGVIPGGGPGSGYMKKWGIIGLSAGLFALALGLLWLLYTKWPDCTPAPPATAETEETATTEPTSSDLSTPSPTSDLADSDLTLGTDMTPPPAAELKVTGVSPATGDTAGGTGVEISGTGFTEEASVLFDKTEATVTSVRPTAIQATTPAHAEGAVDVSVQTKSGTVGVLPKGFTYRACGGERAILLLVLIAGALGGTLHSILSLYWYVGNRELKRSWVPKYAFLPLTGAALACVFFLCISGGIINSQNPSNRLWIVGLAALIGLFSEQGFEKLKKIFEALFTSVPPAADKPQSAPTGTTMIAINPTSGPQAGGTPVTITGTGFLAGTTVQFGTVQSPSVQVQSPTTLSATTPATAATGAVDVTVTIPGGSKATLPGGFTYHQ